MFSFWTIYLWINVRQYITKNTRKNITMYQINRKKKKVKFSDSCLPWQRKLPLWLGAIKIIRIKRMHRFLFSFMMMLHAPPSGNSRVPNLISDEEKRQNEDEGHQSFLAVCGVRKQNGYHFIQTSVLPLPPPPLRPFNKVKKCAIFRSICWFVAPLLERICSQWAA